jgi:ABC-2 type transport system permease protein
MFWKIFSFEIKYRIKRPATYAYFFILFLFALLTGIFGDGPSSEKAYVNSAYWIGQLLVVISIFEMLIASAVMGVPVYRDIEYKTKDYFFTYPITEKSYILGRYLGSFVILIFISLGVILGYIIGLPIGVMTDNFEAERLGPFVFQHYLYNTLIFTIPNLLFTGTLFFALVALTKNVKVTYVSSALLFIGYLLANALVRDLDNKDLVDILDPFAFQTFVNVSKYWTPAEQNVTLAALEGNLLWNRLLWLGISLLVFAFTIYRFSFADMQQVATGKAKMLIDNDKAPALSGRPLIIVDKVFSTGNYFKKMFRLAWLEFTNVIKDVYFIAIFLAAAIFVFLDAWFGASIYGTPALPLTYYMLEVKDFNYTIFVFIIIIFYTGEVVHRDKSVNYSNIADALPVPNWMIYGSKFLSLVLVSFMLTNLVLVCGLLNQVFKGYFNFEFGMYFTDLYLIEFPEYLELVMLAFIVHILVNSKFMGHVATIGVWILIFCLRTFADVNYNLFLYSNAPAYTISDMNGFGHFMIPTTWFNVYWLSLGIVFLLVGNLFWNRGSENSFKARWQLARERLNFPIASGLVIFSLIFIGSGVFIYYNMSVLNVYRTAEDQRKLAANFEKKFKQYELVAQPKITGVKINIDLYPSQRSLTANGAFTIVNKTDQAIDSLFMFHNTSLGYDKINSFKVNDAELPLVKKDTSNGFYCYLLAKKLSPGDTAKLEIQIEGGYKGFTNAGGGGSIVYNGTFVNLGIFPQFGYPGDMMNSDKDRKKYGLPKKDYTLPPQNDKRGLSNFLFNNDADWISYEAVVSTEKDQLAISPGYLQKEWEENGRKYYHYKMDNPIDLFANFSSARYAVHRDVWENSEQKVNIELFYHPTHTYNLDRFVKSVKASMDYFTKNFSPYQFKQMRILEFPRYLNFAQSFPNTVPYAESFGWVADFSDPEDTDYAFYVTSHEVAHQWWGHQVMPSATRGSNQISESMAEYSALMVLKHEYGDESMQRFLKYSLDSYLRGRAAESKFEATLLDNDSRQYVWYRKGSLILYALQDLIGEDNLNKSLKTFIDSSAHRVKPPFVTSGEWYSYIRSAVPDSLKYYVEDSFEKITLYENRVLNAEYEKIDSNNYKVTLKVQTRKIYYDGLGKETGVGTAKDYIDIGVFAEDKKNERGMTKKVPLYLRKHWLTPGEHTITLTVKGIPRKAGIDPYNKLIDRIPDDNLKTVNEK